ncbi:MAG TPA: S8 family serine peptidase [Burkholderiales bacterium]|nr:S8 family serine peptidase [Burkholderiales bacterium]
MIRASIAALVAIVLTIGNDAGPLAPVRPVAAQSAGPAYVEGELLVRFKPAAPRTGVAVRGHSIVPSPAAPDWVHVRIAPSERVANALASYRSDPAVESVQPNYIYRARGLPNDSQVGQLWALRNTGQAVASSSYSPNAGTAGDDMNVEKAWDHVTDCSGVVVAVLDSGVNYSHEDLAGNMWDGGAASPRHGADFIGNDDDPMDENGHGTHVAGIIGASGNNATGISGVCWKASIMAVRVLDATGVGTTASLTQGVNFAVSHGAKVINMSIGGASFDPLLAAAITNAQAKDVAVIAAAGNDAANVDGGAPEYPCAYAHPNLLCVTALDQTFALAAFANYGATSVDVGAPGTNILSAVALQTTSIPDAFNSAGALDWTSSGGWAWRRLTLGGRPVDVLANPVTFPSGSYANSADQRVYKSFTVPSGTSALVSFSLQHALQPGDTLSVGYRVGAGDPFAGGTLLQTFTGTTSGLIGPFSYDISACVGKACTIGFRLASDASNAAQGVGITAFEIDVTGRSNVAYRVMNGTSMAAPQAAGLAAMLRAYNPQYTYADVLTAISAGGRAVPSLSGRTTSGRALDAMSSLSYIAAPTGVAATFR